jgi:hypothetical protein
VPGDIILWRDLKQYLEQRMEVALSELDKAEGLRDIGLAQGKLRAFREMKNNLPETLRMLTAKPEGEITHGREERRAAH